MHAIDHVRGTQGTVGAARPPNPELSLPVGDDATDPQRIEVTDMVGVQMAEKHLVEVVVGNLHRGDPLGGSEADVEDELVAVPEFDDPAGGSLLGPGVRHPGAAGDDPHLIGRERLAAGVVHVPRAQRGGRIG